MEHCSEQKKFPAQYAHQNTDMKTEFSEDEPLIRAITNVQM